MTLRHRAGLAFAALTLSFSMLSGCGTDAATQDLSAAPPTNGTCSARDARGACCASGIVDVNRQCCADGKIDATTQACCDGAFGCG